MLEDSIDIAHPNFDIPFQLFVDASEFGVGAVFTQVIDQNEKKTWVLQPAS